MESKEQLRQDFDSLFDEWQRKTGLSVKDKTFSPDGVVNPEVWLNEATKSLFVLKETNRWCDIREYVVRKRADGKAPKWQTWYNIARWTYLLRHHHDQSFDEMWQRVKRIDEDKRINNLNRVALINVKKRPGGKSTDTDKLIAEFERNNREFLPREIALLGHLDHIICCGKGVASCISQCFDGLRWERPAGTPHRLARTSEGTIIIDFVHPQSREKKKDLFRRLYNAITWSS